MARYTDRLLIPMEPAQAEEIRRRAAQDARPVAAYVRLLLAAALAALAAERSNVA